MSTAPVAAVVADVEVTLEAVIRQLTPAASTWLSHGHGDRLALCPVDGDHLGAVGIPSLAYTFEVCRCGDPAYPHLVEQLWHRGCLAVWAAEPHVGEGPEVEILPSHLVRCRACGTVCSVNRWTGLPRAHQPGRRTVPGRNGPRCPGCDLKPQETR